MGGSQQQLDAMIAETMVPILATPSARLPFVPSAAVGLIEVFVAHGDVFSEAQQSWALVVTGSGSLDMANLLVVVRGFSIIPTSVAFGNFSSNATGRSLIDVQATDLGHRREESDGFETVKSLVSLGQTESVSVHKRLVSISRDEAKEEIDVDG